MSDDKNDLFIFAFCAEAVPHRIFDIKLCNVFKFLRI